jgi:phage terminase small subunit
MPIEILCETEEFKRLTNRQQRFIREYIVTKYDPIASVRAAYRCKSDEVARVMSYPLLTNIKIISVLNRHFATDPINDFLVTLQRAIHNKHLTIAQIAALRLYSDVKGWGTALPTRSGIAEPAEPADSETPNVKKPKKKQPPRAKEADFDLSDFKS